MNGGTKIKLAVSLLGIGLLSYVVLRNPKVSIVDIDWSKKEGVLKFGTLNASFNNEEGVLLGNAYAIPKLYGVSGGGLYGSNYKLYVVNTLDRAKTVITVLDKNGVVKSKTTIDWKSKIKY